MRAFGRGVINVKVEIPKALALHVAPPLKFTLYFSFTFYGINCRTLSSNVVFPQNLVQTPFKSTRWLSARCEVSSQSQEDKRFNATIKHIGHTTVTLGISNDVVGIGYLPRGKLNWRRARSEYICRRISTVTLFSVASHS